MDKDGHTLPFDAHYADLVLHYSQPASNRTSTLWWCSLNSREHHPPKTRDKTWGSDHVLRISSHLSKMHLLRFQSTT